MFSNSDERTKEMDVVKTNLGDIDLDRLRDSACFAIGVGPWERDSLSPMGELRLAGCLAYADWVAHDRELSMKFAESWSAAAEADWTDLSPEAKADALAFASSESHGSDLRLAVNAGLHACDAAARRQAVCRARQITKPRPTLIDISGTSLRALGQNDSSNALSGFADKL